jgi:hypothetical protein
LGVEASQLLSAVEGILASHRGFGDSDYIQDQMQVVFKRRLERIAGSEPAAGRLLDAFNDLDAERLRCVMGDTALRCAIQHATWGVERGWKGGLELDLCTDLFRETTALLKRGYMRAPLEFGATRAGRLGLSSHSGWIWNNEHADDPFLRAFQKLIQQNYRAFLSSPTEEELGGLRQGAQLLTELMPRLSRSALSHAHIIGVCPQEGRWKGSASSSQFRLTGTIFLDRESVSKPWWVVEHMFHEALHQKLYDFRHGHTLFEPYDPSHDLQTIQSPWNSFGGDVNRWDTFRAFAAFHVYVHLALLGAIIEQRQLELMNEPAELAESIKIISSRKAIDRARYLGDALQAKCWDQLGVAGKRFHEWLTAVLNVLDPSPGRADAYIHLLLDLYRNETNRVYASAAAYGTETFALLREEVETTRSLLYDVAASEDDVERFNATVSRHLESGTLTAQERFYSIRTSVSETIQGLCHDGRHIDARPDRADPNETVWKMIQRSSERINVLLTPTPTS